MKKVLLILFLLFGSFTISAQSVAINTDKSAANASAMLDIKSTNKGLLIPRLTLAQRNAVVTPATGLLIYQTDNTAGYYYFNGSAWTSLTGSGSSSYWSANGTHIFKNNLGNVGIGTSTPSSPLSFPNILGNKISFWNAGGNNDFGIGINTGMMQLYTAGTDKIAFGWGNSNAFNETMTFYTGAGQLGIGITSPLGTLDVTRGTGWAGTALFRGTTHNSHFNYDVAEHTYIRGGKTGSAVYLNDTHNGNVLMAMGGGRVGIGITSPLGTLDVTRGTGFGGTALFRGTTHNSHFNYDVAENTYIRGGKTGSTVYLNDTHNGNVVIATGGGRVGIGTNTPRALLDVIGFGRLSYNNIWGSSHFAYYALGQSNFEFVARTGAASSATPVNVSIYASDRIAAFEFNAYSDARIKNISGTSNTAKDLETIQALQIRDYTMRDKVKYGDQTFKKVIAQEVEKVYSQVVSKHTDFIPNVYQLTSKIEKTAGGYLLGFANHHHISKTAKKLQLLLVTEGMQQYDIVSIISDTEVLINAVDIKTDKVFVYGEEVDDFRTVDYEGLITLNISATQQLGKLITAQNKKIAALAAEIKMLKLNRVTSLKTKF